MKAKGLIFIKFNEDIVKEDFDLEELVFEKF